MLPMNPASVDLPYIAHRDIHWQVASLPIHKCRSSDTLGTAGLRPNQKTKIEIDSLPFKKAATAFYS
jgi:hypothetical protein